VDKRVHFFVKGLSAKKSVSGRKRRDRATTEGREGFRVVTVRGGGHQQGNKRNLKEKEKNSKGSVKSI